MILSAKIGTHSLQKVKVFRKRNAPKVGDTFEVYESLDRNLRPCSGTQPIRVRCTEIRDIGGEPLYFLDRW